MIIDVLTDTTTRVLVRPAGRIPDWASYMAALKQGGGWAEKDPAGRWRNVARRENLPALLQSLQQAGFQVRLEAALKEQLQQELQAASTAAQEARQRLAQAPAGHNLFPFQVVGVEWLAQVRAGILADDMGLGKTVQGLMAAPQGAPVLVVAPANAKFVWARHCQEWRPDLTPAVLSGRGSFRWPAPGEMIITNYDILPAELPGPAPAGCVLIADEFHAAKNAKAQRTRRFRALAQAVRAAGGRVWGLTGTPLLNRGGELLTLLENLGLLKQVFGSWRRGAELLGGYQGRYGWEWGQDVSPQVPAVLEPVMLRRLKSQVLADLPAKRREFVPVELSRGLAGRLTAVQKRWEEAAGADLEAICARLAGERLEAADIEEGLPKVRIPFEELSALRAEIAEAMIPALLELVEEHEEAEEPLVVASCHLAPLRALAQRPGWALITGDTAPEERRRIEEAFQGGRLKGVGLTIRAGGVAITLTRASNMVFVDLDWTPALNAQCEDRIHRIGQQDACLYRILVPRHPLTERLSELLAQKVAIISASTDAVARRTENRVQTAEGRLREALAAAQDRPRQEAPAEETQEYGEAVVGGVKRPFRRERRGEVCYREPRTPQEIWAAEGCLILAGLDQDYARRRNDAGFNREDGGFGHEMADRIRACQGLSDRQWAALVRMLKKYWRQIGRCPEEVTTV